MRSGHKPGHHIQRLHEDSLKSVRKQKEQRKAWIIAFVEFFMERNGRHGRPAD